MAWLCNLQHLLFNPLIKPAYPTVQFLGIIPPAIRNLNMTQLAHTFPFGSSRWNHYLFLNRNSVTDPYLEFWKADSKALFYGIRAEWMWKITY